MEEISVIPCGQGSGQVVALDSTQALVLVSFNDLIACWSEQEVLL